VALVKDSTSTDRVAIRVPADFENCPVGDGSENFLECTIHPNVLEVPICLPESPRVVVHVIDAGRWTTRAGVNTWVSCPIPAEREIDYDILRAEPLGYVALRIGKSGYRGTP